MTSYDTYNLGLWIVDVQTKLFPFLKRNNEVLEKICFAIQAAQLLQIPIIVTEQNPLGLGETEKSIKDLLPSSQPYFPKTFFSGHADPGVLQMVDKLSLKQWVLVGVETHICIYQTAKDLLRDGREVTLLNDATTSRSEDCHLTALAALRQSGAQILSTESLFYELFRSSEHPGFKAFLSLVKMQK